MENNYKESRLIKTEEIFWASKILKIAAIILSISFFAYAFLFLVYTLSIDLELPSIFDFIIQISNYFYIDFLTIGLIILIIGINKFVTGKYSGNRILLNITIILALIKIIADIILNIVGYLIIYLEMENNNPITVAQYFSVLAMVNLIISALFIMLIFIVLGFTFQTQIRENGSQIKMMFTPFGLILWFLISASTLTAALFVDSNVLIYILAIAGILFGLNVIASSIEFILKLKQLEKISVS